MDWGIPVHVVIKCARRLTLMMSHSLVSREGIEYVRYFANSHYEPLIKKIMTESVETWSSVETSDIGLLHKLTKRAFTS